MNAINVKDIMNLDDCIVVNENTESTKSIVDQFNRSDSEYFIVKDFWVADTFDYDDGNTAPLVVSFLVSKNKKCDNIEYTFTFTELIRIIKPYTLEKIENSSEKGHIYNLRTSIFNSILYKIDELYKVYADNKECEECVYDNLNLVLDLDFCIELNAQDSDDSYGNMSNIFYIEKVLFMGRYR